jgi:hypothetical protein
MAYVSNYTSSDLVSEVNQFLGSVGASVNDFNGLIGLGVAAAIVFIVVGFALHKAKGM